MHVELSRCQMLCHPSGECDSNAPGGIHFLNSFRYVVPQFHLPTINSISVIINLLGQLSSETPCSIVQLLTNTLLTKLWETLKQYLSSDILLVQSRIFFPACTTTGI